MLGSFTIYLPSGVFPAITIKCPVLVNIDERPTNAITG